MAAVTSRVLFVRVPPPGDEFQQHHAVAVHVHFGCDWGAADPLGCKVTQGSPHRGQDSAEISAHKLGHPEIRDLGA